MLSCRFLSKEVFCTRVPSEKLSCVAILPLLLSFSVFLCLSLSLFPCLHSVPRPLSLFLYHTHTHTQSLSNSLSIFSPYTSISFVFKRFMSVKIWYFMVTINLRIPWHRDDTRKHYSEILRHICCWQPYELYGNCNIYAFPCLTVLHN